MASPPVASASLAAAIASTIGLLGLLLASIGIYGTVSYIVLLRTREVGIRMAVGTQKRDVLGLILREIARPVIAGLLAGMFLAAGLLICCAVCSMDSVPSMASPSRRVTFVSGHRAACRLSSVPASHARGSHGGAEIRMSPKKSYMKTWKNWVDGKWVEGAGGKPTAIENPATGRKDRRSGELHGRRCGPGGRSRETRFLRRALDWSHARRAAAHALAIGRTGGAKGARTGSRGIGEDGETVPVSEPGHRHSRRGRPPSFLRRVHPRHLRG